MTSFIVGLVILTWIVLSFIWSVVPDQRGDSPEDQLIRRIINVLFFWVVSLCFFGSGILSKIPLLLLDFPAPVC